MQEEEIFSGNLRLQSVWLKTWNTRRFKLAPTRLIYYENANSKQERGFFPLIWISELKLLPPQNEFTKSSGGSSIFTIKTTHRTLVCAAPNEKSAKEWIDHIEKAKEAVRKSQVEEESQACESPKQRKVTLSQCLSNFKSLNPIEPVFGFQKMIPGLSGETNKVTVEFEGVPAFSFSLPIEFKRTREYVWIYELEKKMFYLSVDLAKPLPPEKVIDMLQSRSSTKNTQPEVTQVPIEGHKGSAFGFLMQDSEVDENEKRKNPNDYHNWHFDIYSAEKALHFNFHADFDQWEEKNCQVTFYQIIKSIVLHSESSSPKIMTSPAKSKQSFSGEWVEFSTDTYSLRIPKEFELFSKSQTSTLWNFQDFQVTVSSTEMALEKELLPTLFPTLVAQYKQDVKDCKDVEKKCGTFDCLGCLIKQGTKPEKKNFLGLNSGELSSSPSSSSPSRSSRTSPVQCILHLYAPFRMWRVMCQTNPDAFDKDVEVIFDSILESFCPKEKEI